MTRNTKEDLILITGSSGYVAKEVVTTLRNSYTTIGVDVAPGPHTDYVCDIGSEEFQKLSAKLRNKNVSIINLAAARFDFGSKAGSYYHLNVTQHREFLKNLDGVRIAKFIQTSSVAALDGRSINYSSKLKPDDAYRSTKYLQEKLVREWCADAQVPLVVLYPSAIFSQEGRMDTNIGKMQKLLRFLPFIPRIDVRKSITFLPSLCAFIQSAVESKVGEGAYLAIERPVLSVTEILQSFSSLSSGKPLITIPQLRVFLMAASRILYVLGGLGRYDMKLTPNRVQKLFSDTSYDRFLTEDIDTETYSSISGWASSL